MVVVAIVIVRMDMITPGGSFAEPVVGAIEVCRASRSVLYLCTSLGEWRTDDELSVPG